MENGEKISSEGPLTFNFSRKLPEKVINDITKVFDENFSPLNHDLNHKPSQLVIDYKGEKTLIGISNHPEYSKQAEFIKYSEKLNYLKLKGSTIRDYVEPILKTNRIKYAVEKEDFPPIHRA